MRSLLLMLVLTPASSHGADRYVELTIGIKGRPAVVSSQVDGVEVLAFAGNPIEARSRSRSKAGIR